MNFSKLVKKKFAHHIQTFLSLNADQRQIGARSELPD